MFDTQDTEFLQLRKIKDADEAKDVLEMLLSEEMIVHEYKNPHVYVVFTNMRIIIKTQKSRFYVKMEMISIPYKKINTFSVGYGNSSNFTYTLAVQLQNKQELNFEFSGDCDLPKLGRLISSAIL